jgi:hypothetical protein
MGRWAMPTGPMHGVLTFLAVAGALATVVFANLGMTLASAIAAVFAIAMIAEGWRRKE